MWRTLIGILLLAPALALAQSAKYCEPKNPYDPAAGCGATEAPAPESPAREWLGWGPKQWEFHLGLCRDGSSRPWYVHNCAQLESISAFCHGPNVGEHAKAMCAQFFGEPLSATMMAYIKAGLEHKEGLTACLSVGKAFDGLQVGSLSKVKLPKQKVKDVERIAAKTEAIGKATKMASNGSKVERITSNDVLEFAKKTYGVYDKVNGYAELAEQINGYVGLVQVVEPWRMLVFAGGLGQPTAMRACNKAVYDDYAKCFTDANSNGGLANDLAALEKFTKALNETDTIKCLIYSDELLKQLGVRS